MIKIVDNCLFVAEKKIEFDFCIETYLEYRNIIIVLLHIPNDQNVINNIYGIDLQTARILWQVEDISQFVGNPTPYHTINLVNNNLFALTWDGGRFIIDQDDGRIIYKDFSR